MYCPKCKQTFEEGSRRFCPTDGARLASESGDVRPDGGIFGNLIPKMDAISDIDQRSKAPMEFDLSEPEPAPPPAAAPAAPSDDFFFEFDDIDYESTIEIPFPQILAESQPITPPPEPVVMSSEPAPAAPEPASAATPGPSAATPDSFSARPIGRKVNPDEIPAGHVRLEDTHRATGPFSGFDESDPQDLVGRIVKGRYVIVDFLGGDENGLAYLADDRIVDDKKVLVRILTNDETDDIMASILAEERVSLSHFSHPNISRLIDSGQFTNGTQFLVSEFVDALSARDILNIHGQFGEQRAARIIRQVSGALSEAHQQGILHRDLRPENFIIDPTGDSEQVKLVNFGASNGEPNPVNVTYKAPEVLDGRANTVASDVFSLGVVAYEMLTGRMPFEGGNAKEIIRSEYAGPIASVSDLRPDLPEAVDDVFEKALSFRPAGRFRRAREFGDALSEALADANEAQVDEKAVIPETAEGLLVDESHSPKVATAPKAEKKSITLQPEGVKRSEPAWKNRSPEPPSEPTSRTGLFAGLGILALLIILGFGWYYVVKHPVAPEPVQRTGNVPGDDQTSGPTITSDTEMPPQPRSIPQPPNSNFYQNSKQNLKGDLLLNFVGFTLYYPKDWKVNGPEPSAAPNSRGNFLDISRVDQDGRMKEQMLVSYYPSKGTYSADADKFPELVKESTDALKKLVPGYQTVSDRDIKVNGDWQAYEMKFQGGGTSPSGEKLVLWGRRLFIPAARPGIRNGFMITMLATSLADDVHSVDDVGNRGELKPILYSFEPSQNF